MFYTEASRTHFNQQMINNASCYSCSYLSQRLRLKRVFRTNHLKCMSAVPFVDQAHHDYLWDISSDSFTCFEQLPQSVCKRRVIGWNIVSAFQSKNKWLCQNHYLIKVQQKYNVVNGGHCMPHPQHPFLRFDITQHVA